VTYTSIQRYYAFLLRQSVLLLAVLVSGHSLAAFAQTSKGAIRGTVADPTGAVIPNASVTVTTPDGHTAATVTSNGSGAYQAGNLAPGTYIVIGNAAGFAASASKA
jgi:Carboxypeptidase regulatory-like domain